MGRKALSPPKADCRAAQDAAAGVLETGEERYFLRRCSRKCNALHQPATSRRGAVIGVFVAVTLVGLLGFGALAINPTQDPWDLTVFRAGDKVTWNGSSDFYGSLPAPNAVVSVSGDGDFDGAVVGKELETKPPRLPSFGGYFWR